MPEGKHDLYIGVNNELSPLYVDLKALTRGLVVVGQSGCGKSFMVGRLVEELIRKTTKKTRLLIIDSNSDFCEGTSLKEEAKFGDLLDKYKSGLLGKEFGDFRERELRIYEELKSKDKLTIGQLFGRKEEFNLSWKWLVDNDRSFFRVVKGEQFSVAYDLAFRCLRHSLKKEHKDVLKKWFRGGVEVLRAKKGETSGFEDIDPGLARPLARLLGDSCLLELAADLGDEETANIWRKKADDKGMPERLFADSRVNLIEVETIAEKKSRLKTVAFILLHCWTKHVEATEKVRDLRNKDDKEALSNAEQDLKHTFILIDEAHNYAPDETNDPHKKMLGELIHTIAAEGRKYGLHVILATQRPNKIKRGLLGECDNAIIMKMNSRSDLEHLASEMRILDVKLLEPCLHFQGQGNALAVGEMTRMAPYVQLFKAAPRRTREGGVDIPDF